MKTYAVTYTDFNSKINTKLVQADTENDAQITVEFNCEVETIISVEAITTPPEPVFYIQVEEFLGNNETQEVEYKPQNPKT